MKKQMIEVGDTSKRYVQKKKSFVTRVKSIFWGFSIIWIALVASLPLYVKDNYSGPIKKTMVVSMFFDLQKNISGQYEELLSGIKKSINLEKPIAAAIDSAKIADKGVSGVQKASKTTSKLTGIAGKFGVKTDSVDKVVSNVDKTTQLVNSKLDNIKSDLVKTSKSEIDKMIDEEIKKQLDKTSGGLGSTLLTNYGVKYVYPWRPSSWPVGVKIYNDLSKSSLGVVQILTNTVDKYFGYVAWGLVVAAWLIGLFIWMQVFKKVKMMTAPFIICPKCGHAFSDKRTAYSLLKLLKPWTWL